ncbi:hypothetical protein [Psychrobium sp. 1_MG-2023]|uniref:hypothetical protein n=1 Tax=Psychrobium sp. 1_MG-2023 TaxID=3062624 RepID=UPI00129229F1|nr:hypothetical protein [Psychrobium sp. 1_MG-2023]MDP2560260.1 hypothetical protein [Psychrobium sp. 1_MG-2023]
MHRKSQIQPNDLNLRRGIEVNTITTNVYVSSGDAITPSSYWESIVADNLKVQTYDNLKHLEMVMLFNKRLMRDIASDLLGKELDETDTKILGVLCNAKDTSCLEKA